MKRTYKITAGIIATVALGLAAAAYAHPGGGFGPGYGPCTGDGPHGRAGNVGNFNPTAMIEGHLAYQKAELKITKAQESAWQAYSAKAREQAAGMLSMHTTMLNTEGSAPERMAQRETLMKQRLAGMETMSAALKDLYTVLTPEQKAIADREFDHMGGRMGGYRGGYGRGYGRR
ncbi:MAG TPA: Spy/CpxP family protein refolding chaperone [Rhodocyclaceae bacterium]|nr:Spy/CpxP family protein refolding chaperone [Rhodocyclaceae bacterium]